MSDPYRPGDADSNWARPEAADPAYAGQMPHQSGDYPPPTSPDPTAAWSAPTVPPAGVSGPAEAGPTGPAEPPRSPKWLWAVAAGAVLLVAGMVIALVIANGSGDKSATGSSLTPMPGSDSTAPSTRLTPTRTPSTTAPRTPTTTPSGPSTTSSPDAGNTSSVLYSVTGTGQAISISYLGTGGAMKTELNVPLPWTAEAMMPPSAATAASVTIVTLGAQVTCTLTLDGTQVRQQSGSLLTICSASHQ